MKQTKGLGVIGIVAFLFGAYSCSGHNTNNGAAGQIKEYSVSELKNSDITLYKEYPTVLQGQQTVEIRPRVTAYIEEILVDEGDFVKKGQILFKLNANDIRAQLRSAEAQVKVTEAQVSTAQINLDKTEPLVEKDIISQFELESAKTSLASAEAQNAQAKANLANVKANLSYTVITSPTDGIIGKFPYRVGSLVSSTSTQPLTVVSNTSSMQAYFSVNEKDFLLLTKGIEGNSTNDKLKKLPAVKLIMADNSEYPLAGKVETASGIVDQQTGAISIRASFQNPQGELRSGGTGRVKLPEVYHNTILIPQDATFDIQGKHFVYVVNGENKVVNTPISVIAGSLKDIYVVTSGLAAGDKIVTKGISSLRDGMVIKPILDTTELTSAKDLNLNK